MLSIQNMLVSVIFLVLVNKMLVVPANSSYLKGVRSRRLSYLPEGTNQSNLEESVASGTQMAIEQCQNLFQWDRWNCPKITFSRQKRVALTKENAFAKAILAAGIAHSITQNCSQGKIDGCSCKKIDNIPLSAIRSEEMKNSSGNINLQNMSSTFANNNNTTSNKTESRWGCSDNLSFAGEVTRKIVDSLETGIDISSYVARHNSIIGIKIFQNSTRKKCRCHGISGSCAMKTCWMQVVPFQEISRKLKQMIGKSIRVTRSAVEKSIIMGNSAREDFVVEKEIPGTEDRLIYLDNSPDYCVTNFSEGYAGTKGRRCSRNRSNTTTKAEKNSCRNLCKKCGHSVKRMQKKVTRRCNCKFSWCCEVKCDTCQEVVNEYFCV